MQRRRQSVIAYHVNHHGLHRRAQFIERRRVRNTIPLPRNFDLLYFVCDGHEHPPLSTGASEKPAPYVSVNLETSKPSVAECLNNAGGVDAEHLLGERLPHFLIREIRQSSPHPLMWLGEGHVTLTKLLEQS